MFAKWPEPGKKYVHSLFRFSFYSVFLPVAHLRNVCRLIKASFDLLSFPLPFSLLSIFSLKVTVCVLQECQAAASGGAVNPL